MPTAPTSLLEDLLHTQDRNNQAAGYKDLRAHALQVAIWARQFDKPILLAVDPTAQRLLGAATILAGGDLDAPVFSNRLDGRTVLIIGSIAATTVDLDVAAAHARKRGARSVHGFAIDIESPARPGGLDSLTMLHHLPDAQKTA